MQMHASLHAGPMDKFDAEDEPTDDVDKDHWAANLGDSTLGDMLAMGPDPGDGGDAS